MKQVIVMRKDLNMRKGKMCSQAAHASMAVMFNYAYIDDDDIRISLRRFASKSTMEETREWFFESCTKICVGVNSENELMDIFIEAATHDVPCALITDKGLTEFNGVPTKTCGAIGPAPNDIIDRITGHLKLL